MTKAAGSILLAAHLSACSLLSSLPKPTTVQDRLAMMPTDGLPVEAPVTIYWNAHKVPFIEAETDRDAAVALGLVHAHLRLGQMELLRRIVQGRLAESGGPLATDIDHSLRVLGIGRAAPDMAAALSDETRAWLEAFVTGINHYVRSVRPLPHEFTVLGLAVEPWRVEDLMAIGRLASVDVNWLVWFRILKLRERDDWPELWARMVEEGTASIPSISTEALENGDTLSAMLTSYNRSGSNSFAVSAERSQSGAAMIASDPHLGLSLPNLWLLAGYKSPSYHTVGLMIPGLPFVALGRNPWIAWGGTNMHAASSDLYDVSSLPPEQITTRTETVRTRWWFDRDIEIRETPYGPIVSDAPLLEAGDDTAIALRWMGHFASDEVSAMLGVNKARGWDDFRTALDGFWVPGQNMVYADINGDVGQVMAVKLPRRPPENPDDPVLPITAAQAWQDFATAAQLPAGFRPALGFQASANNRPAAGALPAGYFFSSDDRIQRITELLRANDSVSLDDLKAMQQDVYKPSAAAFSAALSDRLKVLVSDRELTADQQLLLARIAAWDGAYAQESKGAVAYELLLAAYVAAFYDGDEAGIYDVAWRQRDFIKGDFYEAPAARTDAALLKALEIAADKLDSFENWGDMHRLKLAHPLNMLPLIGGRYGFGSFPVGGSLATIMTTGHSITDERHDVRFGSNARHISDLSDPDANYFVLVGGQDGWLNSSAFLDQVDLWRDGDYVQVPMRLETVRRTFTTRMTLSP